MNEHVLAAVIADNKAEALLRIEEFDDASAFANDLCGHATTGTAATAAETTTAAAETTAATAAESVAAAAKAIAAAAEAVTAAKTATITAVFTEAVALVASASAAIPAATLIETHAVPVLSSNSPACSQKYHAPDAGIIFPGAMSQCAM